MTKTNGDKLFTSRNMKDELKQVPLALKIAPLQAIPKVRWADYSIVNAEEIIVSIYQFQSYLI